MTADHSSSQRPNYPEMEGAKQREGEGGMERLFKQQTGSGCFQSSLPSCCFPSVRNGERPRWVERQPTPHRLPALCAASSCHLSKHFPNYTKVVSSQCVRVIPLLPESTESRRAPPLWDTLGHIDARTHALMYGVNQTSSASLRILASFLSAHSHDKLFMCPQAFVQ